MTSALSQGIGADNETDIQNVPAVAADHSESPVIVSVVPPFVQVGGVPISAMDEVAAGENTTSLRVASPTAAAVVPATPGTPVCSFAYSVGIENDVPAIAFSSARIKAGLGP